MKTAIKPETVFEALKVYGHDEDFQDNSRSSLFRPTDAPPGSQRKIDILQRRLELGVPLWHPRDNQRSETPNNVKNMCLGPKTKVIKDNFSFRKGLSE